MRKEVWFGLTIMAAVVLAAFVLLPAPSQMTNGHLGLLMLALVEKLVVVNPTYLSLRKHVYKIYIKCINIWMV